MGELQWVLVDKTQKQDKLGQGTGMSNSLIFGSRLGNAIYIGCWQFLNGACYGYRQHKHHRPNWKKLGTHMT